MEPSVSYQTILLIITIALFIISALGILYRQNRDKIKIEVRIAEIVKDMENNTNQIAANKEMNERALNDFRDAFDESLKTFKMIITHETDSRKTEFANCQNIAALNIKGLAKEIQTTLNLVEQIRNQNTIEHDKLFNKLDLIADNVRSSKPVPPKRS